MGAWDSFQNALRSKSGIHTFQGFSVEANVQLSLRTIPLQLWEEQKSSFKGRVPGLSIINIDNSYFFKHYIENFYSIFKI